MFGCARSFTPVAAEPVKVTTSWPGEVIHEIADAAADQLQRAVRQNLGFNNATKHQLGQISRLARRLDERGNAGEQTRRDLLEHAPAGKVERVDVDGDAAQRRQNMLPDERAVARQRFDFAFDQKAVRRQLAPAARGVGKQHANAAFDVDGAVGPRGAGGEGEFVEFLLALGQMLGEPFQHVGAADGSCARAAPCRRARGRKRALRRNRRRSESTRATAAPVAASRRRAPSPAPSRHAPARKLCSLTRFIVRHRRRPQRSCNSASDASMRARQSASRSSLRRRRRPKRRKVSNRAEPESPKLSATRGRQ